MKFLIYHFISVLFFLLLTVNLFSQSQSTPLSNDSPPYISTNYFENPFNLHSKQFTPTLSVKVIESQSYNSGHVMDTMWRFAAQSMGNTAAIVPQTTLDDTTFFSSTDILIISSGVIDIPSNRVTTIQNFLMRHKNVYIQSEYLSTYTSSQAFATIVTNLGGTFSWGSTVSGTLAPMIILGTLSNTPNNVPSISYFWYGLYGTGNSTIENYMQYQSNYFGFVFNPTNPNYGIMITNSDQDWVRSATSVPLMQNIMYRLATITGIQPVQNNVPKEFNLSQNYPNPFNPETKIRFDVPKSCVVNVTVYDELGKEVTTLVNRQLNTGSYEIKWNASNYSSGIYYYKMTASGFSETKKMLLIK